ncbi:hypothetical protein [Pseudonocardia nigra]|uniref:hypothetical protein n=1 Tax=Pseudonocardia nigra TaxID=1921578 RepID=UPI001C5FD31A|nr:hypothetical protein [Pseudonocardia nigra]
MARDTLSGALAAAAELPADLAGPLVASARSAFVAGMQLTAWAGAAAAAVVAAVVVTVKLRR